MGFKDGDTVQWTKCTEGCDICRVPSVNQWHRNEKLSIMGGYWGLAGFYCTVSLAVAPELSPNTFHVDDKFDEARVTHILERHLKKA